MQDRFFAIQELRSHQVHWDWCWEETEWAETKALLTAHLCHCKPEWSYEGQVPRPPMELHSGSIITQNDWLMNFLMNCSANFQKNICRVVNYQNNQPGSLGRRCRRGAWRWPRIQPPAGPLLRRRRFVSSWNFQASCKMATVYFHQVLGSLECSARF